MLGGKGARGLTVALGAGGGNLRAAGAADADLLKVPTGLAEAVEEVATGERLAAAAFAVGLAATGCATGLAGAV